MIKFYLVPAEIIQENGEDSRRPKYMDSLRLNWTGVYIDSKDIYAIMTNEITDTTKFTQLEANSDVQLLDGTKKSKDLIKSKLGVTVGNNEDEVEILARLTDPAFKKSRLWVGGQ